MTLTSAPLQSAYNRPPPASGPYPPSQSSDPKIAKLLANLTSERKNLQGANAYIRALQASSKNEAVIKQAQNEVRNAQANIKFLEDELAKLQLSGGASPAGTPVAPASPQKGAGQYPSQQQRAGSPSRPGMQHAFTGQSPSAISQQHSRGPSNAQQGSFPAYPSPAGAQQRGYSSPHVAQSNNGSMGSGERPLPAPPGAGVGSASGAQGAGVDDDALVRIGGGQAGAAGTSGAAKNYTQLGTSPVSCVVVTGTDRRSTR